MGVHRLVNGAGEQVLVEFGQAAPRYTSPDRARCAEETAQRAFVGVAVESEQTEDTIALAIEYGDGHRRRSGVRGAGCDENPTDQGEGAHC